MPQYDTETALKSTISSTAQSFSISEVWIIISILLALIGGVFLYTTYFSKDKDKENDYKGTKKTLYDFFNFKITIIEPIFRVCYLVVAIAITLCSFAYITSNFFKFVGVLVFGNIIARLFFELLLLSLKLFDDVSEINKKLKKESKTNNKK